MARGMKERVEKERTTRTPYHLRTSPNHTLAKSGQRQHFYAEKGYCLITRFSQGQVPEEKTLDWGVHCQ